MRKKNNHFAGIALVDILAAGVLFAVKSLLLVIQSDPGPGTHQRRKRFSNCFEVVILFLKVQSYIIDYRIEGSNMYYAKKYGTS